MRKGLALVTLGSVAMLQACTVSAIDSAAVAENGLKVNYGFSVDVPGSTSVKADYNMEVSPDQVEKMSIGAVITDQGQVMDLTMDDILIVDKENIYINVKEGKDTVEALAGNLGVDDILPAIGITEAWVSFPIPAFEKLGIKIDQENMAKTPEISDEMLNDLMGLVTVFAPEENDGVVTFKIDNEKILEAAKQADAFMAAHQEEVMKFASPSPVGSDMLDNLNLTEPFEKYINAVGAGIAQATGVAEDEAIAQVNELIEQLTEEIVNSFNVSYSANGEPVTPETIEGIAIYEAVEESLEGRDILIECCYDSNSAEFVWRTDNAKTYIVDAAMQDDGTIKVDLSENENAVATGIVSMTADGINGVFTDMNGNQIVTADITLTDNGINVVLTNPSGEEMKLSAELSEDGIKAEANAAGTAITFKAGGKIDETSGSGNIRLDMTSEGETGYLEGYATFEVPSSPLTIEIPVASDGLEVIKNVTAMIVASSQSEE